MTKALFINGSPRKIGNTSQLLKRAMDGAREAGAEVELVNLYDRNLNYKGCMSCFACKIKGGKKGVCSFFFELYLVLLYQIFINRVLPIASICSGLTPQSFAVSGHEATDERTSSMI